MQYFFAIHSITKNIAYQITEVKLMVTSNSNNLRVFNFANLHKSQKSRKFDAHFTVTCFDRGLQLDRKHDRNSETIGCINGQAVTVDCRYFACCGCTQGLKHTAHLRVSGQLGSMQL